MDYNVNAHYWFPARLRKNTYPKQEQKRGTAKPPYFIDSKSSLRLLNSSGRWRGDQAVCSKIPSFAQWHLDSGLCHSVQTTYWENKKWEASQRWVVASRGHPNCPFPLADLQFALSSASALPISLGSAEALWQWCCTATAPLVCPAGTAKCFQCKNPSSLPFLAPL